MRFFPQARGHRQGKQASLPRGFALIATLLILSLLAMLAIGMLSLSQISSRSAGTKTRLEEARANARFGLLVALAELQQDLGPDQAISAPAAIFDANPETAVVDGVANPHLIGVWESRSVKNTSAATPGNIDESPNYDRQTPFRRWLVSNEAREAAEELSFAQNGQITDPVKVAELPALNSGNLSAKEDIFAGRVTIEDGAYAWWVSDENMKARVNRRPISVDDTNSVVANHRSFATPGHNGRNVLTEFAGVASQNSQMERVSSIESLELVDDVTITDPVTLSQDITVSSESVLADVTRGALRQDLSLYLEQDHDWDQQWPRRGRPSPQGPEGPLGPNNLIALSGPDAYDVMSWRSLHDYYKAARNPDLTFRRTRVTATSKDANAAADPIRNPEWNHGSTSLSPVVARVQMLLSLSTREIRPSQGGQPGQYQLFLHKFPTLTLWNPYNVPLTVRELNVWLHTLPLFHTIRIGRIAPRNYTWDFEAGSGNTVLRLPSSFSLRLEPGAVVKLFPNTFNERGRERFGVHEMTPQVKPWTAVEPGTPHIVGATFEARPQERIIIETKAASWEEKGSSKTGNDFQSTFGVRVEAKSNHFRGTDDRFLYSSQICWRREQGVNPKQDNLPARSFPATRVSDVLDLPTVFAHVDVRMKTLDEPDLPNKTWLHNIPSHGFAAATSTRKHGTDGQTPFYAHPYTLFFEQASGSGPAGFSGPAIFGESVALGSGQRVIIDREVPLAPLTSIAQLQNLPLLPIDAVNWSGYYLQNKAIGNSYASPGLKPDEVRRDSFPFYQGMRICEKGGDLTGRSYPINTFTGKGGDWTSGVGGPLIVDRSYVANELLFDRYFFSSIAGQDSRFEQVVGRARTTLEEVFDDFMSYERDLPNTAYKKLGGLSSSQIKGEIIASSREAQRDSHRKIAAYLSAEGGFNINSTSVRAWETMLASAHKKKPTLLDSAGGLQLGSEAEFAISRFSTVHPDAANGSPQADQWLGYRELTRDQIKSLAEAIVEQVKIRGPFRSLGEFVNRRLTTDTDLALSGALQAALDDARVNINDRFQRNPLTQADIDETNYEFPEAALGSRFQGTPDYVSQADVLTAIAPVINARSDTFTIRAYGESGDGETVAWCEAVVQRQPEYVDEADEPWVEADQLTSELNQRLGRRFVLRSIRWLDEADL